MDTTPVTGAEGATMTRRAFVSTCSSAAGAVALSASGEPPATAAADGAAPNIVIIVCDQMVLDAISAYRAHLRHGSYLCHWVDTPHLDGMVAEGTSFLESHSTNPVCCPARSSLFTGRMPVETGVIQNNIGIDRSVPNMGQWFEAHTTYDRVYCGKWHAGGPWNNPTIAGPRRIPGFDTLPNGPDAWGRHMDYGISSPVEAYIRNQPTERPFLIVAGFMDPHDICFWGPNRLGGGRPRGTDFFGLGTALPVLPPNQDYDFEELFAGPIPAAQFSEMHWRNYIYDYCRMIERLDANVGRIMQAVRDRNDNTIVIFTADHGDGVGRHRRVQKWHPYDESVRVPFIVHGPRAGIRRGVVDQRHLVTGLDLMSTVCDYAGIPTPPHARGLSLRPLLEGTLPAGKAWRESIPFELRLVGRGIRTERFKYVMSYVQSPPGKRPTLESVFIDTVGNPAEARPGAWHELKRQATCMLFDLHDDPWETRNLASDPALADVVAHHTHLLHDVWEPDLIPGHHFTRD